jgi:hypothetical protein
MAVIVGDSIVVDKDALSPDSISAATEIVTHRLLDKAASKGWSLDWATTKIRIDTEGYSLLDKEARITVEAEMLR